MGRKGWWVGWGFQRRLWKALGRPVPVIGLLLILTSGRAVLGALVAVAGSAHLSLEAGEACKLGWQQRCCSPDSRGLTVSERLREGPWVPHFLESG